MAKMSPFLLLPKIKSTAERKIFALFHDAPDIDKGRLKSDLYRYSI
jgi:hypothetical protein